MWWVVSVIGCSAGGAPRPPVPVDQTAETGLEDTGASTTNSTADTSVDPTEATGATGETGAPALPEWRTSIIDARACLDVAATEVNGQAWIAYQRENANISLYVAHPALAAWSTDPVDTTPLSGVGVDAATIDGRLSLGYGAFGQLRRTDAPSLTPVEVGEATRGAVSVTALGLVHTDGAGDAAWLSDDGRTVIATNADADAAVAADGALRLLVLDRTTRDLFLASPDGDGFSLELLDQGVEHMAIAAAPDRVHMTWYRITDEAWIHAELDQALAIDRHTLGSGFGTGAARVDLTVDPATGAPHAVLGVDGRVRHATRDGVWVVTPLGDADDVVPAVVIAGGTPTVASCSPRGLAVFEYALR